MDKDSIIKQTEVFVKENLKNAEGGHDWCHTERVTNLAKHIALSENADLFTVELGALLHDIADSKFNDGDEEIGPEKARRFLVSKEIEEDIIIHIENIISNISFKGGNFEQEFKSKELDVIQDADRIDAMGAIGIARTFNYGGFKNRAIYDPDIKPKLNLTKEEYKNSDAPTINHFYEKLLILKDKMNTDTGKKIAEERHRFMEVFLEQFYKEWNFNKDQKQSLGEKEKILKHKLIGKSIKKIEFYNYNNSYFVFNPDHQWVIDYAVFVELNQGNILYYFDLENQCFNVSFEKTINDIKTDENIQDLGATDIQGIKNLTDKIIRDVEFKWDFYQLINESFELEEEKIYVPTEIILIFDKKTKLQIAGVDYNIDKKTKSIKDVKYDLEGDLLITLFNEFYKG